MTASDQQDGAGEISLTGWIALSLRVMLGAWFLYSGGLKIWGSGLDAFTRDLGNYQLLPELLIAPTAYLVPWAEVIAGLLMALGVWRRGTILVFAGMVTGFIVFIAWAWSQQLDISCGCQGDGEPIRYWFKAFELPGYLMVLAWLWWKGNESPGLDGLLRGQKNQNMA